MQPTIGRIVIYHTLTTVSQDGTVVSQPERSQSPAIIVNVHNETTVNLQVFGDSPGAVSYQENVKQGENLFQWSWPELKLQSANIEGAKKVN